MRCAIWLGVCLGLLLTFQAMASAESSSRVSVILSESGLVYREVADAFLTSLAGKYTVQVDVLDTLQDQDIKQKDLVGDLIVPVGVRSMRRVYGLHPNHASILSLMVPREAAASIIENANMAGREAAVYIDQPLSRSLSFIRKLLPRVENVGLVLSDEAQGDIPVYRQEAARLKIDLVVETVATSLDVPQALQRLLHRVDVLLMLPDAKVVNDSTVRLILLTSYRQQIPVVGFSRGLATAGGVAAVVSDPSAIGHEGALLARQWNPVTGLLPPSCPASGFSLVFNNQVARSLGVDIPEDGKELLKWRNSLE
jgi:hypothetical protein